MQFQINFITDEIPKEKEVKINKRMAVRGVIHYQNKLLLVETNRGDYKFPGGGMEAGETEKEALLREITEETGYVDINIGPEIGRTFEQNIDTECAADPEKGEPEIYFQMESHYYECWLLSEKRAPGVMDDYEEKLGFHATFLTIGEAYQRNADLLQKTAGRDKRKYSEFVKEIPWLERETKVLAKLKRNVPEKIMDAMRECGQIILSAERNSEMVNAKDGHANFVTTYDKKVQEELRGKLLEILPEAVFVGEEEDIHASIEKGYAFIVDPIDGTTNFIKDYHASAISVGLLKDGIRIFGAVYNPYLDEMFFAEKGKGAFRNGTPIHVSKQPLSNGIVLFGTAPYYEEMAKQSFEMAYHYFKQALDIRRSGSAAIDLCSIAAGRAELYFEMKLSPWDYAAGSLIVEEAGGIVTTMEGTPITLDLPCSVLATNRCIRADLKN